MPQEIGERYGQHEPKGIYRTTDEIFGETLKNVGKHYKGTLVLPNRVPIVGVHGVYEAIHERCYHHYDAIYAGQDIGYDYFEPAYRFGAELAASPVYGDKLWVDIEEQIAAMWEDINPNTWEAHRAQIAHGWNLVQELKLIK